MNGDLREPLGNDRVQLHERGCIRGMLVMPDGGVDLVFADPPFNIGMPYDNHRDNHDADFYIDWTGQWLMQSIRVLKRTGTLWVAINDEWAPVIVQMATSRGVTLRNWVIWHYTFGQYCTRKFGRCHTHLLYFVKDKKEFTFNADAIRIPSDRQAKYNDERANPAGKIPSDVWEFPRVCGSFKERASEHPCQMPVAILERIVLACSNPDEIVLDPFTGTGTTGVAAVKHGRRFIGFDLSGDYLRVASERIGQANGTR